MPPPCRPQDGLPAQEAVADPGHIRLAPGSPSQTRAYAQAITETYPETTAEVAKERVDGRMDRQAILFREDPPPPRIHAILDEQVLHRNAGGPAVMAEQLEHLAELAAAPRIIIQVMPAGTPETDQPPAIVYLDSTLDGQVVESASAAEAIDVVFRALQAEALTGSACLARVKEAAQRWKEQITS